MKIIKKYWYIIPLLFIIWFFYPSDYLKNCVSDFKNKQTFYKNQFADQYQNWSNGEEIRPGTTGETRSEVAERMVEGIYDHMKFVPDGNVFVVATHGGAARVAAGKLMGLPPKTWISLGIISNCSWIVLDEPLKPELPWRLVEYNAGSLPTPALSDDR